MGMWGWNRLCAFVARCSAAGEPPSPACVATVAPVEPAEPVHGCGWFDSSHELACGARVTELDDAATPLWRWAALTQA
jgi:hypothetical protein